MRRRILLAILLAVAVTAAALGIPLGVTAWKLVESISTEDLSERASQIAANLDTASADGDLSQGDLAAVAILIPNGGRLVVQRPGGPMLAEGANPGPDVVSSSADLARGGRLELSIPSGPLRSRQTTVTLAVLLLVVLSVCIGTIVATVTARRLAKPLAAAQ